MEIIIFPIIFGGQTPPVAFSYFNKNYVQPEIFPRELGRKIVKAEEIRHASDYDTFYIASKMITAEQTRAVIIHNQNHPDYWAHSYSWDGFMCG